MTPRQTPPLCAVPWVLGVCSLEKCCMGLLDSQEQPGNMSGWYFSEKPRLSWKERDRCLQKGMREELPDLGGAEKIKSPFQSMGAMGDGGLAVSHTEVIQGSMSRDILRTETVCVRDVHLLVCDTGAASPFPSFLQDMQLPRWTCSSQSECQGVEVCGQGEAEHAPSNTHRFTFTSRVAAEGRDVFSSCQPPCKSCKSLCEPCYKYCSSGGRSVAEKEELSMSLTHTDAHLHTP